MRFGVHVSIAGGFPKAVQRARQLDCEAFQIFAGSPRGWARKELSAAEADSFKNALEQSGLGPVIVHLSYLPNPASLDAALYERSVLAMGEDYERANRLGAPLFVFHPGTCEPERREEALEQVRRSMAAVLERVAGPTVLLIENQSSRKKDIAADLGEMKLLLKGFDPARTGFCLDTCHAFAAGYDLRGGDGWAVLMDMLRSESLLERLRAIHANDSKGPLGSGTDRHEHIGRGLLGEGAFAAMGARPELADLPVILETPQKDPSDDPRNLEKIRALAAEGA